MSTLEDLVTNLDQLKQLQAFKAWAEPELDALRIELERTRRILKDVRTKNDALEKAANVLSVEDEEFLFRRNAEVSFRTKLAGGRQAILRLRGRKVADVHGSERSGDRKGAGILKQLVAEGRRKASREEVPSVGTGSSSED